MNRRVLLYPGEDGYTVAEVPSLPGCVSQGPTRDEALANIREAISLHEEVLRERGEAIPEDNVELVEVAACPDCPSFRALNVYERLRRLASWFIGSAEATSL